MNEQEKAAKAAGILGSLRTPKKAASSRINGTRGGRPVKPLAEIACTCGATKDSEHAARCLRGQAYRRRIARAQANQQETIQP